MWSSQNPSSRLPRISLVQNTEVSLNDEFCIKNERFCIKNEGLCNTDEVFVSKMMNFAAVGDAHQHQGAKFIIFYPNILVFDTQFLVLIQMSRHLQHLIIYNTNPREKVDMMHDLAEQEQGTDESDTSLEDHPRLLQDVDV